VPQHLQSVSQSTQYIVL